VKIVRKNTTSNKKEEEKKESARKEKGAAGGMMEIGMARRGVIEIGIIGMKGMIGRETTEIGQIEKDPTEIDLIETTADVMTNAETIAIKTEMMIEGGTTQAGEIALVTTINLLTNTEVEAVVEIVITEEAEADLEEIEIIREKEMRVGARRL
jgi:hypothetical protein